MHKKLCFFLLIVFVLMFIIHSTISVKDTNKIKFGCFNFFNCQKERKEKLKELLMELLIKPNEGADDNITENEKKFLHEIFAQKSNKNKFRWHNRPKIITLSNAPPCNIRELCDGKWKIEQGSGGLVTCVEPVLATNRKNVWIFSHAIEESKKSKNSSLKKSLSSNCKDKQYKMNPIFVPKNDYDAYYKDISNGLLWPAFHNMQDYILEDYKDEVGGYLRTHLAWAAYVLVNFQFAVAALRQKDNSGDFIWVHDYHLMLVGLAIRAMAGDTVETGFFLHIPFQPSTIPKYPKIAKAIFRGMLAFSKVGFQTHRDRDKFVEMIKQHFDEKITIFTEMSGSDEVILVKYRKWKCALGVFPVTIKNKDFLKLANDDAVKARAQEIRKSIFGENASKTDDFRLFFGAERYDYTKGIQFKLKAFGKYLENHPERKGKDVLFQLAVINRRGVQSYRNYQNECDNIAEAINNKYVDDVNYPNWKPIIIQKEKFERRELIAHYLAMDVGVVTPKLDGMNLVSKEMLLCNPKAALILSIGAGTEYQFQRAGLYDENDPNYFRVKNIGDLDEFAELFYQAAIESRKNRLRHGMVLNEFIQENTLERWSEAFLNPEWLPLNLMNKGKCHGSATSFISSKMRKDEGRGNVNVNENYVPDQEIEIYTD